MKRFWRYGYHDTKPGLWQYVLPWRGADEYGRRTVVIPIHPFGWLVWAWRTCHCVDCAKARRLTEEWSDESA